MTRLPIHGLVLAGGKSVRMGEDKALLQFYGRPMVEIAVEKLRSVCEEVGIVGNRDDLGEFAAVVREGRDGVGPVAGIEAGLHATGQRWVMFVPVDVPLLPVEVLRRWASETLAEEPSGLVASYLIANGVRQPAFNLFRADCLPVVSGAIEAGKRRLNDLLDAAGDREGCRSAWYDAGQLGMAEATEAQVEHWFANVNTPEDLAQAEQWAALRSALHPMEYR
jgi:molybdopterin-guanine dinucleotide biosynthesis protein A